VSSGDGERRGRWKQGRDGGGGRGAGVTPVARGEEELCKDAWATGQHEATSIGGLWWLQSLLPI
jgi:hypothetical protein